MNGTENSHKSTDIRYVIFFRIFFVIYTVLSVILIVEKAMNLQLFFLLTLWKPEKAEGWLAKVGYYLPIFIRFSYKYSLVLQKYFHDKIYMFACLYFRLNEFLGRSSGFWKNFKCWVTLMTWYQTLWKHYQ